MRETGDNRLDELKLIRNTVIWIMSACAALNLCGILLDVFWLKKMGFTGYFEFGLTNMKSIPFWLFSSFLLILFNGFAIVRIYYNRFYVKNYENRMPYFPLLGANCISIPFLLILFIVLFTMQF